MAALSAPATKAPSARYQLAIFDFDGTLADSFPFLVSIFGFLAETHGFRRLERDELEALRACKPREAMKQVGLPLWKLPRVVMHCRSLMGEDAARIPLFGGVETMLRRCSERGLKTAILTSNSYSNVCSILGSECIGMIEHFECDAALFGKRRRLRRLLKKAGVEHHEVLCVGDEGRDAEAAHAEGLAFGAVTWGYAKPEALLAYSPQAIFSSVGELADFLCP